jgi:CRISPR-associated protein Csx14
MDYNHYLSMSSDMFSYQWREVVLFIAGETPQIITETIWALATSPLKIYPQEVVVITTLAGKKKIIDMLIMPGMMKSLCRDYGIPEFRFDDACIHVPSDILGQPMYDIRTTTENVVMGDYIFQIVRGYCEQNDSRLHCSLAGGRKTMSFYLGSALQLFGRSQDRLYHVLVSEEFESCLDFFYKPPHDKVLTIQNADSTTKELNTSDAKIELTDLPFLRLREKISIGQHDGFRELLQTSQQELDIATMQPTLIADLSARVIRIGHCIVELIPVQLMVYAAFLRQKMQRCLYRERLFCRDCCACFQTISELSGVHAMMDMVKDYQRIYGDESRAIDLARRWHDGLDQATLRQYITRINKSIAEQLSDESIHHFVFIKPVKQYASSRYGLRLEKCKIQLI